VNHLNIVASTVITNPVTTWLTVRLGSDRLENILDVWPCLLVTTRHQRWTISGTLLTTRDTGTDEAEAFIREILCAAVGIGEMRVTTVNDDITFVAIWEELLNEVVNSWACHNEQHDLSGALELLAELLDGVSSDN
jgi:hypothetical protein